MSSDVETCYDKRLYERLRHGPGAAAHGHLTYQERLVRFVENHGSPGRPPRSMPGGHQSPPSRRSPRPGPG